MTSAAKSGQGSLLKIGDGGTTEVFATIGEVLPIKGPNIKNSFEDVTSHDSPNGLEEFIATFTTLDSIDFECNYVPTNVAQAMLKTKALDRSIANFTIDPAGWNVSYAFAAFVETWKLTLPVKGAQQLQISLKPSGVLTET